MHIQVLTVDTLLDICVFMDLVDIAYLVRTCRYIHAITGTKRFLEIMYTKSRHVDSTLRDIYYNWGHNSGPYRLKKWVSNSRRITIFDDKIVEDTERESFLDMAFASLELKDKWYASYSKEGSRHTIHVVNEIYTSEIVRYVWNLFTVETLRDLRYRERKSSRIQFLKRYILERIHKLRITIDNPSYQKQRDLVESWISTVDIHAQPTRINIIETVNRLIHKPGRHVVLKHNKGVKTGYTLEKDISRISTVWNLQDTQIVADLHATLHDLLDLYIQNCLR